PQPTTAASVRMTRSIAGPETGWKTQPQALWCAPAMAVQSGDTPMKLYFAPGACSLSPHIVLEEAGIAAETEQVNNQEKKTKSGKDYWTINPKGQVPALQLDNGEMLTEGPVIVQYLADQKPGSGLVPPASSIERYRVQEWLNFITSELHKSFGPIFRPTTPDAYKTISKENLGKRFDWIDKQLAGRQYLTGDRFTEIGRASCRERE